MRLLPLAELRELMVDPMTKATPADDKEQNAQEAASRALPLVGLPNIAPDDLRLEVTYRSGNDHSLLLHYSYGVPNTYLIIVLENGRYFGHILLDIGAEYKPAMLSSPHLSQVQEATPELIDQVVAALPQQSDPFVILETNEGTYMQALWTEEGFVLEHQLVTLACHYETEALVTQEQVIAALKSYAFGTYEWTRDFSWRRMDLRIQQ